MHGDAGMSNAKIFSISQPSVFQKMFWAMRSIASRLGTLGDANSQSGAVRLSTSPPSVWKASVAAVTCGTSLEIRMIVEDVVAVDGLAGCG